MYVTKLHLWRGGKCPYIDWINATNFFDDMISGVSREFDENISFSAMPAMFGTKCENIITMEYVLR